MKIHLNAFFIIFSLLAVIPLPAIAAQEGAQTFTLDGRLYDSAVPTNPLLDSSVDLKVQVLSANKSCVLYEEHQLVNTVGSNGYFNIQVGSEMGGAKRTASDPGNSMAAIFQNTMPIAANNAGCTGGSTPATGDVRYFRIIVTPSSTAVTSTLSPDMTLDAVPSAMVAESVSGLGKSDLLVVKDDASTVLNQTNLNDVFSAINYPKLSNLLGGTSNLYVTSSTTGGAKLPVLSSAPSSPTAGTFWYDSVSNTMKYYNGTSAQTLGTSGAGLSSINVSADLTADGTAGGTLSAPGTIGLGTTGVTAGSYAKVTVDAKGRVTAGGTLSSSDLPTGGYDTTYFKQNGNAFAATAVLGTTDNNALQFKTNNATAMTVLSGGNIGIGTTTPQGILDVAGGTAAASSNGQGISIVAQNGNGASTRGGDVTIKAGLAGDGNWYNNGNLIISANNILLGNNSSGSATGGAAVSIGANNNAGGQASMATGQWTTTGGYASFTAGSFTNAPAANQATFGRYNVVSGSESTYGWVATDPLFVVGNGMGSSATSNALTILKSGSMGIGTATPTAWLHLPAGVSTASGAPLKFTSGVLLSTVENGAMEFDGTDYYLTASGARRKIASSNATNDFTGIGSITGSGSLAISSGGSNNNLTLSSTGTTSSIILNPGSTSGQVQANGSLYVNNSTASTSPTTGALTVNGGAGIGGNVNINGNINVFGTSGGNYFAGNVGIGTAASTVPLTIEKDAIGNAWSDGVLLRNSTAGTNGAGQASPALHFRGNSWDTSSSTSSPVDVMMGVPSINNLNSGSIIFKMSSVPGIDFFTVDSNGTIDLNLRTRSADFMAQTGFTAKGDWNEVGATQHDGFVASTRGWASPGAPSQYAPRIRLSGNAWDTSSSSTKTSDWLIESTAVGGNPVSDRLNIGYSLDGATAKYPLSILSNGNIGVGTGAPTGPLDVRGGTVATANTNGGDINLVAQNANGPGGASGGNIALTTGSGAGGWGSGSISLNVGGGASAGAVWLNKSSGVVYTPISSTTAEPTYAMKFSNGWLTDNDSSLLQLWQTANANGDWQKAYFGAISNPTASSHAATFVWGQADSSSSYAERMRIDPSGNVGIGTTSPSGTLDVQGGTAAASANGSSINIIAQSGNGAGTNGGNITIQTGNGSDWTKNGNLMLKGNNIMLGTGGAGASATGGAAVAIGNSTSATRQAAIATGELTLASGYASFAGGRSTMANAMVETVFGQYNSTSGSEDPWSWVATDPLFVIGNGTSSSATSNAMTVLKNGNVGIGTTNPGYTLDVTGTMRVTGQAYTTTGNGSFSILSDARYKDVHGGYARGLDELLAVDIVRFNYKTDNPLGSDPTKEYVGVTAQNLQAAIPEAVQEDKNGVLTVNTTPVLWTLVNAVKDLYRRWLADNEKIRRLEQDNEALKTYLCGKEPSAPICKH